MKVFYGFDNLPQFQNPVVTLGSYDGVHAGHRVLLERIKTFAGAGKGESVVVTFSPHPRRVVDHSGDSLRMLNTLKEKIFLLDEAGIDNLIVVPFTKEFSEISSYDFIHDYLIEKIGVRTLVVGYNHHFGHNQQGDYDYLDRLRQEFGFDVFMQPREDVDHGKVSSTVVRELVANGEMAKATHYLSRPYIIMGRGDMAGTVAVEDLDKLLPKAGKYSVEVVVGGKIVPAQLTVAADCGLSLEPGEAFFGKDLTISFL